ncbi:helix-turn-helix domain-containing protein [Pseudodesulfovibrio sp. JC047]|uniref:helix-turn-helix transcriptional regulator n=1 Tax=Pseudodesulfovibrio sp. JC047 TaxID=2683199 RepID=UPI0013D2087C|nr:helix-turn-helix domain-containing protein [Pseudodesulfovibrio sp. JC047]NDV20013.1 helix-turn-helix domain-containing protein [Pseudodesulfovibrio sp. JC047]
MSEYKDLGPALNWKQVIKQLGCSKSMFYRMVDEGAFPNAFRFGKSKGIRVPQADVDAYLRKKRAA